jgi:hypothetical protein
MVFFKVTIFIAFKLEGMVIVLIIIVPFSWFNGFISVAKRVLWLFVGNILDKGIDTLVLY